MRWLVILYSILLVLFIYKSSWINFEFYYKTIACKVKLRFQVIKKKKNVKSKINQKILTKN